MFLVVSRSYGLKSSCLIYDLLVIITQERSFGDKEELYTFFFAYECYSEYCLFPGTGKG